MFDILDHMNAFGAIMLNVPTGDRSKQIRSVDKCLFRFDQDPLISTRKVRFARHLAAFDQVFSEKKCETACSDAIARLFCNSENKRNCLKASRV